MDNLNLKPVKTEKDIVIEVEKSIPNELIGTFYMRNGGNPYIRNANNHIF